MCVTLSKPRRNHAGPFTRKRASDEHILITSAARRRKEVQALQYIQVLQVCNCTERHPMVNESVEVDNFTAALNSVPI